jgi:PAS domain S-box-containing protein
MSAIRDITARKLSDARNTELAAIVAFSVDAIISEDLSGIIQSWNSGAERLFGYAARDVLGQSISILVNLLKMKNYENR